MADLLPSTPTPTPKEPIVYRPISGLALAGLLLSGLYGVMVLLSTLVALFQGVPFFLPGWAIGIAVVGAVVSGLALYRIRNSEGTLAGSALARWGLWLSLLLGATYMVYTWVTGLALVKQANDFLTIKAEDDTGFFPRLLNSRKNSTDFYQAFLLTLPATSRGGSKADNEERMLAQFDQYSSQGEPGQISRFRTHPLVLALSRDPDNMKIQTLGVQDWKYEQNSYHVQRNYRFTNPEMTIDTVVPVQSSEGLGEGEQRKWFVPLTKIPDLNNIRFTGLGEQIYMKRGESKIFLDRRLLELNNGEALNTYKETDTDWAKVLPKPLQRKHIQGIVQELFMGKRKANPMIQITTNNIFGDWKEQDGRLVFQHPGKLIVLGEAGFPTFILELEFTLHGKTAKNVSSPPNEPAWEVTRVQFQRAVVADKFKMFP